LSEHDILKRHKEAEDKVKGFSRLLDELSTADDKRKALWKEIYSNAVHDRENAYALYISLYQNLQGTSNDHNAIGPMLVRYLERMSKSNEQLIKLAEMIRASDAESQMSPDDMFSAIEGG